MSNRSIFFQNHGVNAATPTRMAHTSSHCRADNRTSVAPNGTGAQAVWLSDRVAVASLDGSFIQNWK